jgi:hypothetical protein
MTMDQGAPTGTGPRLALSPEGLGWLLAAGIVALALIGLLGPGGPPGGADATSPPASPSPSASPTSSSAVGPGSPRPTLPTTGPTPTPTPTPVSTPIAWASEVVGLTAADQSILEVRDRLRSTDELPTSEIAARLRAMNSSLQFALTVVERLERAGAPPEVVDPIRSAHIVLLDANLETAGVSVQDRRAHVTGAARAVELANALEVELARLRAAAGLPPLASPSPG